MLTGRRLMLDAKLTGPRLVMRRGRDGPGRGRERRGERKRGKKEKKKKSQGATDPPREIERGTHRGSALA
jgi:hypothetical protein